MKWVKRDAISVAMTVVMCMGAAVVIYASGYAAGAARANAAYEMEISMEVLNV